MDQLWQLFLTNDAVKGVVLSLVISQLRKGFETVDALVKTADQKKMAGVVVFVASTLVTLGTAFISNHLAQVDVDTIVKSIEVWLVALGTHNLGQDLKKDAGKQ